MKIQPEARLIIYIYYGLSKLPLDISAAEAHNLNIAHNWEGEGVHWSAIEIDFRQALKKNVFLGIIPKKRGGGGYCFWP